MSDSVENRIVGMRFENSQFQSGVSSSIGILDKLKAALGTLGTNGLDKVSNTAKKFSLGNMLAQTHKVSAGFAAMATVGITALANITNRAVNAGINFVKSFTFGPIMDGFNEYELKMGSIQTILANTARYGTKLGDVNKALNQLNHYADKTIYNFGDMTRNVGLFTNAGIKLKDATSIIKGFSNEAAASGTSAQGAAGAAYQLSQALSAGTIRLMDWRSLTNVGLGNANMKDGILDIADAMGELDKHEISSTDIQKDFNGSLEKGWLTAGVMSNYLKIMAGDMSYAQQKALGLSDAQIKAFAKSQKTAEDAATKVRTLSQLMGTLKEAVGSGWATTFSILFGNFNEATKLFTNVNNVIGGALNSMSNARNKILRDWKKLGGRDLAIEGIGNAFKALVKIIRPIKNAFRDVFPPATGKMLYDITVQFEKFTDSLKISRETAKSIRSIFDGVFSILKVGFVIVFGIIKSFASLGAIVAKLIPPLLHVVGAIAGLIGKLLGAGDAAGNLGKILDAGIALRAKILTPIAEFIGMLLDMLADLIETGGDKLLSWLQSLAPVVAAVSAKFQVFKSAAVDVIVPFVQSLKELATSGASAAVAKIGDAFANLGPMLAGIGGAIKGALSGIGGAVGGLSLGSIFDFGDKPSAAAQGIEKVKNALSSASGSGEKVKSVWDKVVDGFVAIGHFLEPLGKGIADAFQAVKDKFVEAVKGMSFADVLALINTGFFIALYRTVNGFVKKFSGVTESLSKLFESAGGTFDQLSGNLKTMQTSVRANIILKIAAALLVLAIALLILSKIPADQLGNALTALAITLALVVAALKAVTDMIEVTDWKDAAKQSLILVAMGAALIGLGLGVLALTYAVKILAGMKVEELKKGLISVGLILGAIVLAAGILSKTGGAGQILIAAAAIGVLALALLVFSKAIKLYASIDTDTIVNGGIKVVATIAAIGLAMRTFPPGALASAASLVVVAIALRLMIGVIREFAKIPIPDIVKGVLSLAVTLGVLVLAMEGFQSSIAGAFALLIVVGAVKLLVPVLAQLGQMPLWNIVKGLIALAGVFLILGLAGGVLAPLVPFILALGQAIALIGVGALAAGAGMLLFATGIGVLAATGAAGFAVLMTAIMSFLTLLPLMVQQIGLALRAAATVIRTTGPMLAAALGIVLRSLIVQVIKTIPLIGSAFLKLLTTLNRVIRNYVPNLIRTGIYIMIQFLLAVRKNIGQITQIAIDIIVKFINTISKNMNRIVTAAVNLIKNFFKALSNALGSPKNQSDIKEGARRVAGSIIDGIVGGLSSLAYKVINEAKDLASKALQALKDKFKINSPSKETRGMGRSLDEGLYTGIDDHAHKVTASAGAVADGALSVMRVAMQNLSDVVPNEINVNPTVTPILDLTKLQNEASKIGSMLDSDPLSASLSISRAANISSDRNAAAEAALAAINNKPTGDVNINIEQNNTSPKALSPVDTYRATKSAVSLAKEALPV